MKTWRRVAGDWNTGNHRYMVNMCTLILYPKSELANKWNLIIALSVLSCLRKERELEAGPASSKQWNEELRTNAKQQRLYEYTTSHFQVAFCLCLKTSPVFFFIRKWGWFTWKWTCTCRSFAYEWFEQRLVLTQRRKATQKCSFPTLLWKFFVWRWVSSSDLHVYFIEIRLILIFFPIFL